MFPKSSFKYPIYSPNFRLHQSILRAMLTVSKSRQQYDLQKSGYQLIYQVPSLWCVIEI